MNYIEQFMEDNNIEVNEEFYITDEYRKLGGLDGNKFFFNEKSQLKEKLDDSRCDAYVLLRGLMTGECKIEKIPQKQKTVWDLKEEDKYYYINCYGEIDSTFYDCEEDLDIIKCGNAFLTEEEAKHEVERRKCEAIMLKHGTRNMMSLANYRTDKFCIIYNNYDNLIEIERKQYIHIQGTIYFESKELAQKAIDEVGEDRLKKYIFNVKE
ncbi:MAG: hypothetical protein PUE66_07940 [Erysipelotrichaceae bacterium]|nr:hypothetical protein [Erysipelotrichaceae bacterium]